MEERLESLLAAAARSGGELEIYHSEARELTAAAFKGAIAGFTDSRSGAAAVRAVEGSRLGSAFTERIDRESLAEAAAAARRNASFMDPDPGNALYEGSDTLSREASWANDGLGAEAKKALALGLEAACYARDSRVVNVPQAEYGEVDLFRAVANGRGMLKTERHRLCYAYAYVMADSGRGVETGVHLQAARSFEGLDPAAIAREAVARAVGKLGAAEPQSGTMRAVLENGAATSLLGAFMGSASAEAIQKGRSRLAGKRGERVGGALFTVVDDPAGPGLRGAAFDDEGLPAARLEVFREGVFLEPLYTVYSARREGAKPNGRGFRGSALASVSASLVNATIPAGSFSLEALAAEAGKGILVTEVEGLHAGLNPVSGDFSCSARGFALEGGRIGAPLRNFTISGNFYELVAGLEAVGSDLREDVLDRFRSPSLLVASLSVSGA